MKLRTCILALFLLVLLTSPSSAEEKTHTPGTIVCELTEFSVLEDTDVYEAVEPNLASGQIARCVNQPNQSVTAYPELKSANPLYGVVQFAPGMFRSRPKDEFHFVFDDSGGTGKGYDRLYLDVNRDGDLMNDPVCKPRARRPKALPVRKRFKQDVVFDDVTVDLDGGPGADKRPTRLTPRFRIYESDDHKFNFANFIAPTARQGKMQIGPHRFQVILGHERATLGHYDHPSTNLYLAPLDDHGNRKPGWHRRYYFNQLSEIRMYDGQWYSFSTTPDGDKLFATPYQGELGRLEIAPNGREDGHRGISGVLRSSRTTIFLGQSLENVGPPKPARSFMIPVGDYQPWWKFWEDYGQLRVKLLFTMFKDSRFCVTDETLEVYGIKVRREKPFVIDFSGKPEAIFASPPRDQVFRPGDTVELIAVLTDTTFHFMIDDLKVRKKGGPPSDATVKPKKGHKSKSDMFESLAPTITITDSSGKEVARGTMPFG